MKTYRNIINKLIKHKLVICVVCTTIKVLQKKMLTIKCKMTNKFSYGTKKVVVILLYLILETEKEREELVEMPSRFPTSMRLVISASLLWKPYATVKYIIYQVKV